MLDKEFCRVYNENAEMGERYEPLVNSLSGQSNTCRQNRREAVTQSQGTLLQTTFRRAGNREKASLRLVKRVRPVAI